MTDIDWQVVGVHDADQGQDLAYTDGLFARHGIPELYCWSRPNEGADPNDAFAFSPMDLSAVLNEMAQSVIDGVIDAGDTHTVDLYEGLSTATFTIGDARPASSTETQGLDPDTPVSTLTWILTRPPMGEPAPLTPERETELHSRVRLLGGESTTASVDPSQQFGPRTEAVERFIGSLRAEDPEMIATSLTRAVYLPVPVNTLVGLLPTAARSAGRTEAVTRAFDEAIADADHLAKVWYDQPEYQTAIAKLLAETLAAAYGAEVTWDLHPSLCEETGLDLDLIRWPWNLVEAARDPDTASRRLLKESSLDTSLLSTLAPEIVDEVADRCADLDEDTDEAVEMVAAVVACRGWPAPSDGYYQFGHTAGLSAEVAGVTFWAQAIAEALHGDPLQRLVKPDAWARIEILAAAADAVLDMTG